MRARAGRRAIAADLFSGADDLLSGNFRTEGARAPGRRGPGTGRRPRPESRPLAATRGGNVDGDGRRLPSRRDGRMWTRLRLSRRFSGTEGSIRTGKRTVLAEQRKYTDKKVSYRKQIARLHSWSTV